MNNIARDKLRQPFYCVGAPTGDETLNLPALAQKVADPTSTHDVVPETTTGMTPLNYDWSNSVSIISAAESVASTTTDTSGVWSSLTSSSFLPSSGEKSTGVMIESQRTSMVEQHWVAKCWDAYMYIYTE